MTSGSDHPSVSSDFTGTVEICDIIPSGMFKIFHIILKIKMKIRTYRDCYCLHCRMKEKNYVSYV